jgi:hypothetical protein
MGMYATATGVTGIKQIVLKDAFSQPAATCEINCADASAVSLGDLCTVDMGWDAAHGVVMTDGIVKRIIQRRPQADYVVTVVDKLSWAVDYYIVPDNPDSAYVIDHKSPEDVISTVLGWAGITGVQFGAPIPATLGTMADSRYNIIQRMSSWDMVETINRIFCYTTYVDTSGSVFFSSRQPNLMPGDVSSHLFTVGAGGDIQSVELTTSDTFLLNKIIVYGANGISGSAAAVSPYLPTGYYKIGLISYPQLLDSQEAVDLTAQSNLTVFNRLTYQCSLKAIGDRTVRTRSVVTVTEPFTGLSDSMFVVFSSTHVLDRSGYSMDLELVQ